MPEQPRVFVVDDNSESRDLLRRVLEKADFEVETWSSGADAIPAIIKAAPACVVLDIMLPDMDGLQVCRKLRDESRLANTRIVVHSAKSYDYDRRRAFAFGADDFVPKPIINQEEFRERIRRLIDDEIQVEFWGVRGTLPVPGQNSLRYGGNTSCVSLSIPNKPVFIFDAGSGIRALGEKINPRNGLHIEANVFISHAHWDHVNAVPFFSPLYTPGNSIKIIGPNNPEISVEEMISEQMSSVYFPITVNELGARLSYTDLSQGVYDFSGVRVRTMLLRHPGNCLGYRVEYAGRSVCYVTDNELYPVDTEQYSEIYRNDLLEFVRGTDLLITDTTYTDAEYPRYIGWGHSCVGEVVDLAIAAGVKRLCLFHHDPGQSDEMIDLKLESAQRTIREKEAELKVLAPGEGLKIAV